MTPRCAHCSGPVACFGAYEGHEPPSFACDECCGHGNEDGWCEPAHDRGAQGACHCEECVEEGLAPKPS